MDNISFINFWSRLSREELDSNPAESSDNIWMVISSIKANLMWLFNTHQGDSIATSDFGLPDMTAVVAKLPYSSDDFCSIITQTIKKYEPRIKDVIVDLVEETDSGGKIYFDVTVILYPPFEQMNRLISWQVDLDMTYAIRL